MPQLRVCVLQLKIPKDTTKTQHSQINNCFLKLLPMSRGWSYTKKRKNKNTHIHCKSWPLSIQQRHLQQSNVNKRVLFPDVGCLEGDLRYYDFVTVMKSLPFSCLSLFVNKARGESKKKKKKTSGPLNSWQKWRATSYAQWLVPVTLETQWQSGPYAHTPGACAGNTWAPAHLCEVWGPFAYSTTPHK